MTRLSRFLSGLLAPTCLHPRWGIAALIAGNESDKIPHRTQGRCAVAARRGSTGGLLEIFEPVDFH